MDKILITDGVDRELAKLTPGECRVLDLVSCGLANKEIGFRLSIATRTVEKYVESLLAGLRFDNRVQLARWAWFYPKALRGEPADIKLHLPGCACLHPRCIELLGANLAAVA